MSPRRAAAPTTTRRRGRGEGGIRRRPDGRWEATINLGYQDGKRQRKFLYGATRREVADKLALVLADVQQGVPFAPDRLTVGEWLDYWLETIVKPEREPTTYDGYEPSVRRYLKPGLGARPLARLQPEHIEQWLRRLAARGTGTRTCQFALQRLRTALNLALRRGYVARNVAELVDMPRQPQRRHAPPSVEDARKVLEATRGDRLRAHRQQQLRDRLLAGARWKGPRDEGDRPTGVVFTSTVGTVLEPRRVDRYYARVRGRTGLSSATFHGLRHDFAGLLLYLGVAPRVVQEMMGHSNYHITMNRYTHVPDALQRDAAARIAAALGDRD